MLNRSEQEPKYGTKLNAKEELAYQQWRSKLPKALQYEGNYDLRGLYKANPNVKPSANMHFPDTYKLPNHPTFSNEGKYFSPLTKNSAGRWQETDSSFNYIPFNPAAKDTVVELKDLPTKNKGALGLIPNSPATSKIKSTPLGYNIPVTSVTANKPNWAKYNERFEEMFPKREIVNRYLTPLARGMGQSEDYYPDRIGKDYEKKRTDFIARALILDRSSDKYTDKEKEIINNSSYKGKSKEYVYKNPQHLPIVTGQRAYDVLYNNDYLMNIPGPREMIQEIAKHHMTEGDNANTVRIANNQDNTPIYGGSESGFNPLNQFLGGSQGLEKSKYKPRSDYFEFMPSYSLKSKLGINSEINNALKQYATKQNMDSIKKNPIYLDGNKNKLDKDLYAENPNLGDFKGGLAWDAERNLPYLSISDAWDFEPQGYAMKYSAENGTDRTKHSSPKATRQAYQQAYLLNKAGNPYKIYDRFYFNPNTGEYIPDKELVGFSNKNGKPFNGTAVDDVTNNNTGSPMSSERPVADWWSKYVNSPKYKERLAGFYQYPDYVQRQRSGLINSMTFRENPGTSSAYYDNGNEVAMSNLQAQALNASRQEIAAHEMGHAVNSNKYVKGAALAPAEADFILKRNKQISPSVLQRFQTLSKESGKPLTELMSGELHDVDPSENLSDIQSLRYLLKQRKLYDAGQQNATPEVLKKAASDPVIRRSFIWKRLKESFGEKELLEIMNKVAINSNKKSSNIA